MPAVGSPRQALGVVLGSLLEGKNRHSILARQNSGHLRVVELRSTAVSYEPHLGTNQPHHSMASLQHHCKTFWVLTSGRSLWEAKHCYLCLDSKMKCSFLEWHQISSAVPRALRVHPHLHLQEIRLCSSNLLAAFPPTSTATSPPQAMPQRHSRSQLSWSWPPPPSPSWHCWFSSC